MNTTPKNPPAPTTAGQPAAFPRAAGSLSLTIKLERHDEIPAFGAFLRCEEQHDASPVIALNVQACMSPLADTGCEDDDPVEMTREDRQRLIITTLMHEFGHALESHFRLPVNEEAIEKACKDWEQAFDRSGHVEGIPSAVPADGETGAAPEGNNGGGQSGLSANNSVSQPGT